MTHNAADVKQIQNCYKCGMEAIENIGLSSEVNKAIV